MSFNLNPLAPKQANGLPTNHGRRRHLLVLAATALGVSGFISAAKAEDVSPDTGLSATLGAEIVNIYYHPNAMGYQVVVTAGTAEPSTIIRFESVLVPGQYMFVSVPRGAGEPSVELRLYRVGDRIELVRPTS